MNTLFRSLCVVVVLVSTASMSRADVFDDHLKLLASPTPKTISQADARREQLADAKKDLLKLAKDLQSYVDRGKGPDTKVRYNRRPVGTLQEFNRKVKDHLQLVVLMQVTNDALLSRLKENETVVAKVNQNIDDEWVMLARAAQDFKNPQKLKRSSNGVESYNYDENPIVSSEERPLDRDCRYLAMIVFRDDVSAARTFELIRKTRRDLANRHAKLSKTSAIKLTWRLEDDTYKGVPLSVYVRPDASDIWISAVVDNVLLSSGYVPRVSQQRRYSIEWRKALASKSKREFPQALARLHRLIDEVQRTQGKTSYTDAESSRYRLDGIKSNGIEAQPTNERPSASASVPFEIGPDGPAIGGESYAPSRVDRDDYERFPPVVEGAIGGESVGPSWDN